MTWLASIVLKAFFLFGFIAFCALFNWLAWKFIPNGRLKSILLRRH